MGVVELYVNEYYGNNFCGSRKAKYDEVTRKLEYEPEPDYPDEDCEEVEVDDEDE
jgi:hypothetical protein